MARSEGGCLSRALALLVETLRTPVQTGWPRPAVFCGQHLALLDVFDCLTPGTTGSHALREISLDDGYAASVRLGLGELSHVPNSTERPFGWRAPTNASPVAPAGGIGRLTAFRT